MSLIPPHGNTLVNKITSAPAHTPSYNLQISDELLVDVFNIGNGTYSPLQGFLQKDDFENVCNNMRLKDGTVWPIPIVLDINNEQKAEIEKHSDIGLKNKNDELIATLHISDIYTYDKEHYAQSVFGTKDDAHPGVAEVYAKGPYLVGGQIDVYGENPIYQDTFLSKYYRTPAQTRTLFSERGWESVVAFQTRNPPHRSHEYLQKCALESCHGLFINPVIGKKKAGDFKDEYIMGAYEILVESFYHKDATHLGILPLVMKYAGPREAVLHAIIRQNFGCSAMIVGRDHAGVGDYYGTYDAQQIFDNFTKDELPIHIFKYEHAGHCTKCEMITSNHTCPHGVEDKILISGTKVREKIQNKEDLPKEFMRKEVAHFLISGDDQFITN